MLYYGITSGYLNIMYSNKTFGEKMIKSITLVALMSIMLIFTACGDSTDVKDQTSENNSITYKVHKIIYFETEDAIDYRASTSGSKFSVVDQDGNIYIIGAYFDQIEFQTNFIIIKTSSDGSETWRNIYKSSDGSSFVAEDIAIGQNGDIYIAGVSTQSYTASDTRDILIMKIDSVGIQQWVDVINTGSWGYAKSIVVDTYDNVFFAGEINQNNVKNQFLIKYSSDGEAQWTNYYGDTNNRFVEDLLIDQSDNVYLTGLIQNQEKSHLIKVDNNGSQIWEKEFNETNLKLAISNNTLHKVSVHDSQQDREINILTMNTSGDTLSQHNVDIASEEVLHSIIADAEGSLYLTGSNIDNNNNNLFFSKLSSESVLLWTHQYQAQYAWTNSILLYEENITLVGTHYNESPTFPGFESITSGTGNIYMIQMRPEI